MRLESFSVTNYRSILSSGVIRLNDLSVVVGKNNEGKSNFLHALRASLELLSWQVRHKGGVATNTARYELGKIYSTERDFPVSLQGRPRAETSFRLDFSFDADEIRTFKQVIGSKLNGLLPVQILVGNRSVKFKILKQGKGGDTLSAKATQIAEFIGSRLQFTYVEAVRTDRHSQDAVNAIVERELASLEENAEYRSALDRIASLQEPLLRRASDRVTSELRKFIPDLKSVSLTVSRARRFRALREAYEIEVDDGTPTPLEHKGDGIKSLAAIGLLKGAPIEKGLSFLAIEEPESHLHPGAIHELRSTLAELSEKYQVAISTHSPVFVNRSNPSANVIVEAGKVAVAGSIGAVRNSLGVRPSDNLVSASLVVLVEGLSDCRILEAVLSATSDEFKSAYEQGGVAIKAAGGVEKIPAQVLAFSNAVADVMCVVDGDLPGRNVASDLMARKLVQHADITVLNSVGMSNAEIEDMLDIESYADCLKAQFGVNLRVPSFKSRKAKWSERFQAECGAQGIFFDEDILRSAKIAVADCVVKDPLKSIHPALGSAAAALCVRVLERLKVLKPQ